MNLASRAAGRKSLTGRSGFHEIKHDGYRLIVQRDGKRIRLWTRNGHDWSDRFPLITEAALRKRKANLSRLLAPRVDGIFLSDFEQGAIGPDLFAKLPIGSCGAAFEFAREHLSS